MPDASLLSSLKDVAPASAAVLGTLIVCYHLIQMIRLFIEKNMKFMDKHVEILERHSQVIGNLSNEIRQNGETVRAHTGIMQQVERSMEANTRVMQDIARKVTTHS